MAVISAFDTGVFCFADLATTDTEVARHFYCTLFGWDAQELPSDGELPYTMFFKDGVAVCAMYEMSPEMAQELSPYWQSYVAVENVDEMSAKAQELGAELLMEPFDIQDAGRMALIADPQGAALALWQSFEPTAIRMQESGSIGWNELYVYEPQNASEFYHALFGWSSHTFELSEEEMEYTEFKLGDRPVGGMIEIQEEWEGVPPHWAVYFQVDDLEESITQVQTLGGAVITEIMEAEGVGEFVVVQDPQGAHFLIIQLFEVCEEE